MTVASSVNKTGPYQGNGITTAFTYSFLIFDATHVKVYVYDTATEATTLKTLTSDYTVSGVLSTTGGTVTFTTPPLATQTVTLVRQVGLVQNMDLSNSGGWYPENHERAFDTLTMIAQQLQEQLNRAVTVDVASGDDPNQWLIDAMDSVYGAADSASSAAASAVLATSEAQVSLNAAAAALVTQAAAQVTLSSTQATLTNAQALQSQIGQISSYADNAAVLAILCQKYADQAASYPTGAPAYNSAHTYNFPDVCAYTDGKTYRCVGTGILGETPLGGTHWVALNAPTSDVCWEIDSNGDLMPSISSLSSLAWEVDGAGDLMPALNPQASTSFDLDGNGDLQPIT